MKQKISVYLILALLAIGSAVMPKAAADSANTIQPPGQTPEYAPVTAMQSTPVAENPVYIDTTNREMRGAWIATVKNTNMKAGMTETEFRQWAMDICSHLKLNGFNTVIFQAKPTADALYQSELAPWSSFITGKAQGTDPGYDPLEIMVSTAHQNGLELHAWINPYRVTMPSDTLEGLAWNNIAKLNPSWVVSYGQQHYLNPGIPEVKTYLVNSIVEIVTKYDIDAIHIDDYFYPYPISGQTYNDADAFAAYGEGYATIGDWRRDNVTGLIREAYASIKEVKSWVQLGISPFGVWRNISSDPTGSETRAGHECFDSLYADTRTWISEGIIDYITPQIYWSTAFEKANYNTLLAWWSQEIATYAKIRPVNLYVGMADYKVGNNDDTKWNDPLEISNQITLNRNNAVSSGQMHYSINSVRANALNYMENVSASIYTNAAITPSVAWKDNTPPPAPGELKAAGSLSGIQIEIGNTGTSIRKYAVYRYEGTEPGTLTESNLLGVVFKTGGEATTYNDTTAQAGKTYTYVVKSLSHTGVISASAKQITVNN